MSELINDVENIQGLFKKNITFKNAGLADLKIVSKAIADGTDMAEGRSRVPYLSGKYDIHSLSAQAIKRVEIVEGDEKPVSIQVHMENPAGVFQIEEVMGRKIRSSGIPELVEVIATMNGKKIKTL